MIVNPYAILDALVAALRLPLGLALLSMSLATWWQFRRATGPDSRTALENRCYLLLTLAVVVQWLNVLSWPLFYLLLQSYVVEWPGVMCIYGVTQIGEGSSGPSRWLPTLVAGLQWFKPALVFASGAWFVVYQLNRQSRTGPLLGRVSQLLFLLGLLAAADAAAEIAYLAIPKKEVFPWSGCCTEALAAARRLSSPIAPLGGHFHAVLVGAYVALQAILIAFLLGQLRWPAWGRAVGLAVSATAGCFALPIGYWLLSDVVAPWILQQPDHACAYDLLPRSPGAVAAVALQLLGCFAVGWANLVHWAGKHPEVVEIVPRYVSVWQRLAVASYVLSGIALVVALGMA